MDPQMRAGDAKLSEPAPALLAALPVQVYDICGPIQVEVVMLRRFVLALFLFIAAGSARAVVSYTDIYSTPSEPGWGVFLVQSDTFQFLAFYIYGADGTPTWYTAQLTLDPGTGNYVGGLYASTGTYFPLPWNPAIQHTTNAGTVVFAPIDIYHATLTYTLTGGPTVVKPVQRFALTPLVLSGTYSGSAVGSAAGCTNPANNNTSLKSRYNLTVAQNGDTSASLTFTFVDTTYTGMVCTVSGPVAHMGLLYQMTNAQYTCTGGPGGFTPGAGSRATIDSFHPTGQGIEGRWSAVTSDGCTQSIHFGAVLY